MKVFLLIVAGAVPLLIATPSKFFASDSLSARADTSAPVDVAQLRGVASKQSAALGEVLSGSRQAECVLRRVDLLSTHTPIEDVFSGTAQSQTAQQWLEEVSRDWKRIRESHEGVSKLICVYDDAFADQVEEREALVMFGQIDRPNNPLRLIDGGREVIRQVDLLRERLAAQIEVKDNIRTAQLQCDQAAYRECLKILDGIDQSELTRETVRQVVELKRRAEFGAYWQDQPEIGPMTSESLEQRRVELRDSPAAITATEKKKLKQIRTALVTDECRLKLTVLQSQESETVSRYLTIAAAAAAAACPENRREVSGLIRRWIERTLSVPEIPVTTPAVSETRRNKGNYIAGVFDRGAGEANYYWYYDTLTSKREGKRWNEQLYVKTSQNKGNIVDHPQLPLPIRSINAFNREKSRLFKNVDAKSAWNRMGDLCHQLDREMLAYHKGQPSGWDEYERALGRDLSELNFDESAKFVEQILSHWDTISELLLDESEK